MKLIHGEGMDENPYKSSVGTEKQLRMFTAAGWLWAAFWLAAGYAASLWPQHSVWALELGQLTRRREYYVITAATIAAYIIVVSLCAACGALVGRHKRGLIIGFIAAAGGFCATIIEVIIAAR